MVLVKMDTAKMQFEGFQLARRIANQATQGIDQNQQKLRLGFERTALAMELEKVLEMVLARVEGMVEVMVVGMDMLEMVEVKVLDQELVEHCHSTL